MITRKARKIRLEKVKSIALAFLLRPTIETIAARAADVN
jgi:hypothetical protein